MTAQIMGAQNLSAQSLEPKPLHTQTPPQTTLQITKEAL